MAATLNTHTCETVKRAFQDNHKGSVKLSDSQVTLYWINNEKKPLKQWVRNRVVEINRFTQDWMLKLTPMDVFINVCKLFKGGDKARKTTALQETQADQIF